MSTHKRRFCPECHRELGADVDHCWTPKCTFVLAPDGSGAISWRRMMAGKIVKCRQLWAILAVGLLAVTIVMFVVSMALGSRSTSSGAMWGITITCFSIASIIGAAYLVMPKNFYVVRLVIKKNAPVLPGGRYYFLASVTVINGESGRELTIGSSKIEIRPRKRELETWLPDFEEKARKAIETAKLVTMKAYPDSTLIVHKVGMRKLRLASSTPQKPDCALQ